MGHPVDIHSHIDRRIHTRLVMFLQFVDCLILFSMIQWSVKDFNKLYMSPVCTQGVLKAPEVHCYQSDLTVYGCGYRSLRENNNLRSGDRIVYIEWETQAEETDEEISKSCTFFQLLSGKLHRFWYNSFLNAGLITYNTSTSYFYYCYQYIQHVPDQIEFPTKGPYLACHVMYILYRLLF